MSFPTFSRRPFPRFLGLFALAAIAGCGGQGDGPARAARGGLTLSIAWPEPSRVIPANAQSLVVQVKQGAAVIDSAVISRPAATLSFSELPVGSLTVVASAFASVDGTGTPLAAASVPMTIVANQTSTVDVTLASTIDHLDVSPSPLTLGALLSGTITVTARDANNAVVLLDPSALSFSSSNSGVVSVTSGGVATAGASVGSATITIDEADSGKSANLSVSVVPAVSVSGGASSLTLRATTTFVATVVGPANTAVTWSVQEGAAGGTVTSGGVYTAPATKGTYHVVATSVADSSRKATATVSVTSGGANVVVH